MPNPKRVNETRDQIKGVNQYQHLNTTGEERALLAADQGKPTRAAQIPDTAVEFQPEGPEASGGAEVGGVTGPTGATGASA